MRFRATPRATWKSLLAFAALLAAAVASGEPEEQPMIEGRWRGTSANAKGTTYEFQKLRHAVLHRASGSSPIFYSVYRDAQPPWPLDLGGFPPGHPRQGKILYCIFAVDQDRMRLACEPGGSKDTAEQKRPKAFGAAQTQEFVREAGPSE